jgi:hypothetical protein
VEVEEFILEEHLEPVQPEAVTEEITMPIRLLELQTPEAVGEELDRQEPDLLVEAVLYCFGTPLL